MTADKNETGDAGDVLRAEFIRFYGPEDGFAKSVRIIPNILNDFAREARLNGRIRKTSETYRLDDGRAEIVLSGTWDGRSVCYAEIRFNGRTL